VRVVLADREAKLAAAEAGTKALWAFVERIERLRDEIKASTSPRGLATPFTDGVASAIKLGLVEKLDALLASTEPTE
jgi:hypothetical protein